MNETFDYGGMGDEEGGGGGDGDGPPVIGDWFPVFLVVGGIAVLAVAATVLTSRGGGETTAPVDTSEEPGVDVTADLGAAAGRAADRLESEEGRENEVYRAWVEMVELLEAGDPQSATPRGFAQEATRAGMAGDDVAALTDLFEEVRYGGRSPTVEREEAAVEILRRIERRYAAERSE